MFPPEVDVALNSMIYPASYAIVEMGWLKVITGAAAILVTLLVEEAAV